MQAWEPNESGGHVGLAGQQVLVTGASGFLGGALALRLANEGAEVRALSRRVPDGRSPQHERLSWARGDLTDLVQMRRAVRDCSVVFHAAALLRGRLDEMRWINVEGTRRLMRAAAEAGVRRVVHVSTISVYGYRVQGDVAEFSPLEPGRDPYAITKGEAEAVVRELGARHDLAYTIIRPGQVYGPGSTWWTEVIYRLTHRRLLGRDVALWFGDGRGTIHYVYIDDVVEMLLLLATHPAAPWEAFHCTPDPPPTWREVIEGYALLGHPYDAPAPKWVGLPLPLMSAATALAEGWAWLRGGREDVPASARYLLRSDVTYLMDKARELLRWQPRVPLEEGIARCAPWLRERGLLRD